MAISTGDGNDTVINAGTISATNSSNSGVTMGIAISTSYGDDVVDLQDGSVTYGAVYLGQGNDTSIWKAMRR